MWMHAGLSPRGLPREGGKEQSLLSQTWHGLGQDSRFLVTSLAICLTSASNYAVWGLTHSRSPWHLAVQEDAVLSPREETASAGGGERRRQPGLRTECRNGKAA